MSYDDLNGMLYLCGVIVGVVVGFNLFYKPDRSKQVEEAKKWYKRANEEFEKANEWYAKAHKAYNEAGKLLHASRTTQRIINNENMRDNIS